MSVVSIVYHSSSGHTKRLGEAIAQGVASVSRCRVETHAILEHDIHRGRWRNDAIIELLAASDAVVFGAPTSMGDVSGAMKCFIDATSSLFYTRRWADKLAAGFTTSFFPSGDKVHALQTLITFALQHGMLWIGHNEARFVESPPGVYEPHELNRLGGWMGMMACSHPWSSPDEHPDEADIRAARVFGSRVARAVLRWGGEPAEGAEVENA
jgi:NAD(P)H dehydrogenase (quinone)